MRYRNLDLEIFDYQVESAVEQFRVRILFSGAGEQEHAEAATVTTRPGLRKRLWRLERRKLSLTEVVDLGVELGEYLFPPPDVRAYLNTSLAKLEDDEGLRIRLRLGAFAVANLPWEYAYVPRPGVARARLRERPDGFFALDRKLSLVRYEVQGEPQGSLHPLGAGPVRFVMLMASPGDYPELELSAEKDGIEEALGSLSDPNAIQPEFYPDATLETLEDALAQEVHIFHFAGHGEFQGGLGPLYRSEEGVGFLVLLGEGRKGRLYSAGDLALYLRGRGIRLAVLGACTTGRRDRVNAWASVAPALARIAQIPAVVGMQFTINDRNAARFSRSLYHTLVAGQPIDTAVHDGRLAIRNRSAKDDRDWGVPVLYLRHWTETDEDGVLFPSSLPTVDLRAPIISQLIRPVLESPDIGADLRQEGRTALNQGDFQRAEDCFQRSLVATKELEDQRGIAGSLNQLGVLAQRQKKYPEAEQFHKQALEILRTVSQGDYPDVAQSVNDLASLYQAMGKYPQAAARWQQVVEIYRSTLGDDHPEYATSLNNLAGSYLSMGLYAKAEKLFLQALEIRRACFGENHPDVVPSLKNLALLYEAKGDYSEAARFCLQALEIQRTSTTLAESQLDVAISLSNLASLNEKMGRYTEAGQFHKQALDIQRAVLEENHPDVAQTLTNLASLYETQGDYFEAEPFYRQAVDIYRVASGENHLHLARNLRGLALLYESIGDYNESIGAHCQAVSDYDKAKRHYREALKIYRENLGGRHPDSISTLNSLAELCRMVGDYAEAEPLYHQALEIYRTAEGENEYIAQTLSNLGMIAREKGEYDEAHRLFKQSLETKEKLGDRAGIASILYQMGQTSHDQGYDQARGFYRQSLELSEDLGDRANIARSLHQLGIIAQAQGNGDEARRFYQRGLAISRELDIEAYVADNLERLGFLVYQQGDYKQARSLDQQSRAIREELEWMRELPRILATYFDENQVHTICLEININYDDLPGEGHSVKAREVVIAMRRRDQLKELRRIIKERRPDVPV